MADEQLRIVIDALNKASDDIVKVKNELGGLDETTQKADKSSKGFGQSWAGLLTGINSGIQIAKVAAAALKQVYAAAHEGAELEYAKSKFDNLSASIDTTANALLFDLREATQGMYSDAELMASAGDFMALGLAKTHDEVVRLSNVAGALNMNMNQLVLTLTNQTTMRFDALGVSVDGFDEKVKKLEASGMSAQDAFAEAFLQQAEQQIDKVGSAADSALGPFMRLESAVDNFAAAQKRALAENELIIWAVDGVAETLDTAAQFQNLMNEAVESGILTEQEMTHIQGQVHKGQMDINDAVEYYTWLMHGSADATDDWAASNYEYITSQEEMNAAVQTAEQTVIDVDLAMKSYNETLLFNIASQGLSADAAMELARSMGLVDEVTVGATEKVNQWKDDLNTGKITLDEYNELVNGLADGLERLHDVDITVRTTYEEVYGRGFSSGYIPNTEQTRASGGPTMSGSPYVWNEYGGEVRVDSNNGFVLSRADAERALAGAVSGGARYVYGGPSADDIARATRDALLTAGVI